MPKPTPKELELKTLISSIEDFAKEAVEVQATKDFGLNILKQLDLQIFCNAREFFKIRENWLETSRTNNLPDDMKAELAEYLEAARQLDKAKDNFDDGRKAVTILKELQSGLEYVVKGYYPKGTEIYLTGEVAPERFSHRWDDLASIELGFNYLHKVLTDPDFKLCVKICALNADHLLSKLFDLLCNRSAIERYIIFEGEQDRENGGEHREQWIRIWRVYNAIKAIYDSITEALLKKRY